MQKTSRLIVATVLIFSAVCLSQNALFAKHANDLRTERYLNTTECSESLYALEHSFKAQETDASCSLASAAMVINAFKHMKNEPLTSQQEILERVRNSDWSKKVQEGGDGVSLDELGGYLEAAFKAYSINVIAIKILHADSVERKAEIEQKLHVISKSPHCFVIANFDQAMTHPDGSGGHFSPVGAYFQDEEQVLIMDVDKDIHQSYWIDTDIFFDALNTQNSEGHQFRGIIYLELS